MPKIGVGQLFFLSVALILATSSLLKLYSVFTDPFYELSLYYPVSLGFTVSILELVVAYFMISLRSVKVRRALVVLLFFAFCLFETYLIFMGIGSCGCAGFVEVPTWFSLAISVAILVFALFIPNNPEVRLLSVLLDDETITGAHFGVTTAAILGCIVYFLGGIFGSSDARIVVTFGNIQVNKTVSRIVGLDNVLDSSSEIYGGETSCKCVSFAIPKTETGDSSAVHLFTTPERVGLFRQRVDLFNGNQRIRLYINANVVVDLHSEL